MFVFCIYKRICLIRWLKFYKQIKNYSAHLKQVSENGNDQRNCPLYIIRKTFAPSEASTYFLWALSRGKRGHFWFNRCARGLVPILLDSQLWPHFYVPCNTWKFIIDSILGAHVSPCEPMIFKSHYITCIMRVLRNAIGNCSQHGQNNIGVRHWTNYV